MSIELPKGPLVSTEWLAQHIDDPRVRVIDIRGVILPPTAPKPHYLASYDKYLEGHIPGAVFVDWTKDIIDPVRPELKQVAPPDQYAALMSKLGIGDDTIVIAYDDSFMIQAGRMLWTLRYYGHDQARVLDGGFKKWVGEGRPLQSEVPSYASTVFTPRPQPKLRRTADEVATRDSACLLFDARSAAEYRGEQSRVKRGGHIPGARNLFYREFLEGPYDTFAAPEVIRERLEAKGFKIDELAKREVVSYCNGGVSATVTAMALEVAGLPPVAIYDGSWNEWGDDESRPIETGD